MLVVLCLPPGSAAPGQTTESSSAEGFYGLLKEVIREAAKWGLEEAGVRVLGPTGWRLCKAVINPGLPMLRNNFPQLFGPLYRGTPAAEVAATRAVRWVDTDAAFRDAVLQQLNTLGEGQRQQLGILIEIRDLSRKNVEDTKRISSMVAQLSQQVAHIESEMQPSAANAHQDWYAEAGRSKDLSERISLYTEAIDHNQNTVMAYFQRGWIYFNQGDFNSAFYDFNRAVQLNPSFAAALTNRGASSQNLGRIDAAFADYTASRELNPAEVANYDGLGRIYFTRRNYAEAYAMAKLALQYSSEDKERYARYLRLSWYALFNRDFGGAIAYANKGIEIDPANLWIYTNLAHGFLLTNQFERATQIYTRYKGIKLSSGSYWEEALLKDFQDLEDAGIVHPQMNAVKVLLCGNLSFYLLFERRFEEAAAYATQALTLDPGAIWVYSNLAHSLLLSGRSAEAIAIYIRYKGQSVAPGRKWESVINEDFDELNRHGISHPDIQYVRALLR
ncbi:MAG: tetratricopeptide repeat protein [Terriglobia bacterium]